MSKEKGQNLSIRKSYENRDHFVIVRIGVPHLRACQEQNLF
jgi:hypothetical protein